MSWGHSQSNSDSCEQRDSRWLSRATCQLCISQLSSSATVGMKECSSKSQGSKARGHPSPPGNVVFQHSANFSGSWRLPSEVAVRNSLYKIQSFWKEKYYLTRSPCDRAPDCQMTFLYWSSLKSHLGYSVLTDLILKISLCILEWRTRLLRGGGEKSPLLVLSLLLDELRQSTSFMISILPNR